MEYRRFGRTGVMVSPIVLGAMNFGHPTGKEDSISIIEKAVDAGINFIDTANVYTNGESERIVGEAVKRMGNRESLFIATKVYNAMGRGPNDRGVSRFHIIAECEHSLTRLGTDHIDLYQLHRTDFSVPQDETLRALDDLVRQGKVRYIGSSTFPAWRVMEGIAVSEKLGLSRYVSEQPPYNLVDRRIENELLPLARAYDLAVIPWSPIAGGILTGKYSGGAGMPADSRGERSNDLWKVRVSEAAMEAGRKLSAYAGDRGVSPAAFALLWVKDQPGVTAPIFGPRTMEQLEAALPVMEMKLSGEDAAFCDSLVPPGSAVADFHNTSGWMRMRV